MQVPIHTVTLDVQDFGKLQQLPGQLPEDFQEVCSACCLNPTTRYCLNACLHNDMAECNAG